jgi:acyl-coenzyme A thioesterase PaaI-like protein
MPRIARFTGTKFMTSPTPVGFGIRFTVADDNSVFAVIHFDDSKEGGQGILHGGAIAAVLDEAMGTAAGENGTPGYTVTMTYNYKSHIPLHQEVTVRGWIERVEGRKVFAACEAKLADGTIAVTGSGIFIQSELLKKQLEAHPYIAPSDKD